MNTQHISITEKIQKQLKIPRWLTHLIYWMLWVIFWGIMWGTFDNDFSKTFHFQIVELPFKLLLVYPVIYYLIPKYLMKARYVAFLIYFLLWLFVIGILLKLIWYSYLDPIYFPDRLRFNPLKFTELMNVIITLNTAMILPVGIKLTEYWMFHYQKSTTLERDKLQAELKFLRTQVNPHFLFNALNSVYALSLKNSHLTTETISRLAEIMRYVIYEASAPKITIDKEINFIENYIAFEKVRVEEEVDVSFSFCNERSDQIPPLLFIPLIENAFKHLKTSCAEKPWVVIKLEAHRELIQLFVENSTDNTSTQNATSGIGLDNLKKRLEILYPEKFNLIISSDSCSFKTVLEIKHKDI